MGEVKEAGKSQTDVGLMGYVQGQRSLFLNAEDGSAIFGVQEKGQIILDPKADKAYIYSNYFWKNYGQDGKPSNYGSGNENGQGLLIDLTTPAIRYGNGNFEVDANGNLTAKNANISGSITATSGTIGGFTVSGNNLSETLDSLDNSISMVVEGNGIKAAEIVAAINKTESSIKISADHVDITGTTFPTLSSEDGKNVIEAFQGNNGISYSGYVHDFSGLVWDFTPITAANSGFFLGLKNSTRSFSWDGYDNRITINVDSFNVTGNTYFHDKVSFYGDASFDGNVDFSGATVTGLNVVPVFGA